MKIGSYYNLCCRMSRTEFVYMKYMELALDMVFHSPLVSMGKRIYLNFRVLKHAGASLFLASYL